MNRLTIVILTFSLYLALAPIPALAATSAACGTIAAADTTRVDSDDGRDKLLERLAKLALDSILQQVTTETDDDRVKLQKRLAVLAFGWMVIAAGAPSEDTILEKCGVDADGDGRRDTYVAFVDDSWLGLADVTGDGRVDYVWFDRNGDGTPQLGELRRHEPVKLPPPQPTQPKKSQGPQPPNEGENSEKGPKCK